MQMEKYLRRVPLEIAIDVVLTQQVFTRKSKLRSVDVAFGTRHSLVRQCVY